MKVFDRIPNTFFNLLACREGNGTYRVNADCLLEIYALFENEISYKISRDMVRDTIAAYLVNEHIESDEGEGSPNDRAGHIIRSFYEAGWLSEETDDLTYEKQVVMTENGITLAECLLQLAAPPKEEYSLYLYDIYDKLSNEQRWAEHPYIYALQPVYQNAKRLSSALKKLSTSLREVIKKITEQAQTPEELHKILMAFTRGDFIKEYSRLVTEQNIYIYRRRILEKLNEFRTDKELFELTLIDCFIKEELESEEAASRKVFTMLESTERFINRDYNRIMDDIKKKFIIYLNLAAGRMRFILSHDKNTRGNVEQVLKLMVEQLDRQEDDPDFSELFNLYRQDFIDTGSVRSPNKPKVIKTYTVTEVPVFTQEDRDRASSMQRYAMYDPFARKKMAKYVSTIMGDKQTITAEEFPLSSKNGVLAALASIAYSEENGFSVTQRQGYIETNGITIRDFEISKKGARHGKT